jgi:hypothetical protein
MKLRAILILTLALICGPATAVASTTRSAPRATAAPPMVFYVVRGGPDACGRGCDSWIAVEGQVDSGAAARFRKFLQRHRGLNLPMYFSSPGGNLDQALAMGGMLRERPVVARVGRTVVQECGFEAQDSDVCVKLKQSGRELHGDLWTRGAMCNSACPYLILGATTREISPDALLAVHSPKVVLTYRGQIPSPEMRAVATERGLERANRMLSGYIPRMGVGGGLLDLAKTVKFESLHVLTREELIRFGIDRREFVETPWTFENSIRSMVHKSAMARGDAGDSYRTLQWRLICLNSGQFELDFQRQTGSAPAFGAVSISSGGPKPLYLIHLPVRPAGFDLWGLRMTKASVLALADLPQIDATETGFVAKGRPVARSEKLSTEGLASALNRLLATCPPQQDMTSLQTGKAPDAGAK